MYMTLTSLAFTIIYFNIKPFGVVHCLSSLPTSVGIWKYSQNWRNPHCADNNLSRNIKAAVPRNNINMIEFGHKNLPVKLTHKLKALSALLNATSLEVNLDLVQDHTLYKAVAAKTSSPGP